MMTVRCTNQFVPSLSASSLSQILQFSIQYTRCSHCVSILGHMSDKCLEVCDRFQHFVARGGYHLVPFQSEVGMSTFQA